MPEPGTLQENAGANRERDTCGSGQVGVDREEMYGVCMGGVY